MAIVMPATNLEKLLRFIRGAVNCLAVMKRNDLVIATVHDEDRAGGLCYFVACGMLESGQSPDW